MVSEFRFFKRRRRRRRWTICESYVCLYSPPVIFSSNFLLVVTFSHVLHLDALRRQIELKLKVKTEISLCTAIMQNHPLPSLYTQYYRTVIHQLESVQKLALKICSHCWDIDYHILLDMFTLPTLASRREYLRILTLFKIITGCFYFPPNILFPGPVANPQQTLTNKNKNLYIYCSLFSYSFF